MNDGRTYWDADAEAKAKQRKQEQGSDTPEYILKRPITAEVRQRCDVELMGVGTIEIDVEPEWQGDGYTFLAVGLTKKEET
jgi:hypothetical protein